MSKKNANSTVAGINLSTKTEANPVTPLWLPEVLLHAEYWRGSGLLERLQQQVRIQRGRMGHYEVCDFVLLLIAYAVSGEESLAAFFAAIEPIKSLLMAAWGRHRCPVSSTVSRFLAAVDTPGLEALRQLFEADLFAHGLPVSTGVGLYDRCAQSHLVFDIDGTACAVRQRFLSWGKEYPQLKRRSSNACAPGYRGRKRGEAVRTRTTVAQAHSSEWLGTFGAPGSGTAAKDLEQACGLIRCYLEQSGLTPHSALVRLDGLYGSPGNLSIVQQAQLGYLVRCRDYPLLKHPAVQARLSAAIPEDWEFVHANQRQQLLDVGFIEDSARGYTAPMRLLIMRTPIAHKQKVRVGKRVGDFVYELFMTSEPMSRFRAIDVLGLYYGRGGFEKTLSDEDTEQDADRWCSWQPQGQEFWQILSQWVWNTRVWFGWQKESQAVLRQTLWSPALSVTNVPSNPGAAMIPASTAPTSSAGIVTEKAAYEPMKVAEGWARSLGKFSGKDFKIVDERTVLCPAGCRMHRRQIRYNRRGDQLLLFGINPRTCLQCVLRPQCHADGSASTDGRRVSVIRKKQLSTSPPEPEPLCSSDSLPALPPTIPHPILWVDVPATHLRRSFQQQLRHHATEIDPIDIQAKTDVSQQVILTRHQRAHHRLSWQERLQRNGRSDLVECWAIKLFGVPQQVSDFLKRLQQEHSKLN